MNSESIHYYWETVVFMSQTNKICCVIGHRQIDDTADLRQRIYDALLDLIRNGADTFLFGSRSKFDSICLEIITDIKQRFPHIRRVYVRAEYPNISEDYRRYLLSMYDETYFPENVKRAGRASYVKRNFDMIDKADVCVFYYNESYVPQSKATEMLPHSSVSGTKIAFEYARTQGKKVINLYSEKTW